MKLSMFTALISAALIASSVVAQSSGECTCYGTAGRVRHLQKQDLFPQKNLVQQNDIKVANVEVTSRLRDVSPDDFDRAAMRVLQKASGKKGGKGGKGVGGKKEGKKGGKKGETDDYFMIPDGDDKLDNLVQQYCSCQEVCDDYFVEPCIEEPATGKKGGKKVGKKGGKGGKKVGKKGGKGGKGGKKGAAKDEKGGKAEKGTAKTSASSAFVNATEGVRSLQTVGKKGGKGGKGDAGGKKGGKKGGKGGKKGELCPPGGKKAGKGGKKGGKKAGKKGVIDGGICRPVCTCQNYLTFAPVTPAPVAPNTPLDTPEPTTPEPTTGPPVGEPSQGGEPTGEPSTAPPTTSPPTPVPPTTSPPTPVPPTTSPPTPVPPTTSPPTAVPAKDCIETCICNNGDQVTVNFVNDDALFDDWAGLYKCKKNEEDTYNYHPEAWLFTCYDGVCQGPPPTNGTLVFQEPFPEYTDYGPFSWPLVKGQCYVALLSRNVGRSPPPYDLICVGEEFIF